MENNSIELIEKIFPFWEELTDVQQQDLVRGTAYKKYDKGANIHGGSGKCTGGIIVKSGVVRVYLLSSDGKEITLYRIFAGEICMLSASCVIESITFDVFVDAEEATECYIISPSAFLRLTQECIKAENFALNLAVTRFSEVVWVMQQILTMSYDKRLAIFLNDEIAKSKGSTVYLTQEQIAKYTGSAREVVSRMLKYFAKEGIAEAVRGGVKILDKQKLLTLATK